VGHKVRSRLHWPTLPSGNQICWSRSLSGSSCRHCLPEPAMDGSAFDRLTKTLTEARSRRRTLIALLAGGVGFLGAEADDAVAHNLRPTCKEKSGRAKRTCLRKARKHAAQHAVPPTCPPTHPEACGGTCHEACRNPQTQMRNPEKMCTCCTRNGYIVGEGGCCSGQPLGFTDGCVGRPAGASCSFDAQCQYAPCSNGICSS
jgi:hypothetical protein